MRERAHERGGDEDQDADPVDARRAVELTERGKREQRRDRRDLVGVHDPDRRCRGDAEFARHRW